MDRKTFYEKIIYGGVTAEEYRKVIPTMTAGNKHLYHAIIRLCIIVNFVFMILSLAPIKTGFGQSSPFMYIIFASIFGVLAIINNGLSESKVRATLLTSYATLTTVFLMTILYGPVFNSKIPSISFIVLLFSLPMFITDTPIRVILFTTIMTIIFLCVSFTAKTSDIFEIDLAYAITASILSDIVAIYMQCLKINQFIMLYDLKEQRDRDGLTKCYVKEVGIAKIRERLLKKSKAVRPLLVIDIDNFKSINDTKGHLIGDVALTAVGKSIRFEFGDKAIIARFGGDEFIVFFTSSITKKQIEASVATIKHQVQLECSSLLELDITFSCGVAFFPYDGDNYDSLFSNADKALYAAKKSGKDRICYYEE